MSDVAADLTIHHCPPQRIRAIATILEDREWIDRNGVTRRTLDLGRPYELDPISSIEVAALTEQLITAAPEMAFTICQSPTDEWPGSHTRHVPGLGQFESETNHDGEPVFTAATVLALDALPPDQRLAALGIPWSTAIAAMPAGAVREPEPCTARWTPATGEVTVLGTDVDGSDIEVPARCTTTVDDDGNLGDHLAADEALAASGFHRANPWEPLNTTCRLWGTGVYRRHDTDR
ncbi:hypothetical protein CFP71_10085 [Amycolatopsis thailandensis]|uniref:Uncharacterized protein n=1 Tax=Amycolatopsis thailandensis TaxID=589330 RepID=A0A229SE00_9PSEU|nr:hypothetical protein [Amycolatopsis thailandensis]OXM57075.1 hypothetical protein CFP71_10085 [Amycolatopsis thailandensis]